MKRFKILNKTGVGRDTKVFFIDNEGTETEISGALTHVEVSFGVDDMCRAQISMRGYVDLDAEIKETSLKIKNIDEGAKNDK